MEEMMKMLGAMGGMGAEGAKGEMADEAQRLWKMLDDLAENDPQGYGKFLSKQMEGAKELAPKAETRPAFCMQCKPKKPVPACSTVFINVTHCKEVAEPYADDSLNVSVSGSEDEDSEEEQGLRSMRIPIARTGEPRKEGGALVCEVAVNSLAVLRAAKEAGFRDMLERTVLAAATQFFKVELSPHYTRAADKFKGDKPSPVLLSVLPPQQGKGDKASAGKPGASSGAQGKGTPASKKPLIQELKKGQGSDVGSKGWNGGSRGAESSPRAATAASDASASGKQPAKGEDGLLRSILGDKNDENDAEVVSGLEIPPSGSMTGDAKKKPLIEEIVTVPKYHVEESFEDTVVKVEMPLAEGVGEMDLLVSQNSVAVSSSHYKLELKLDQRWGYRPASLTAKGLVAVSLNSHNRTPLPLWDGRFFRHCIPIPEKCNSYPIL